MEENRASVERVRFDEYETEVEDILTKYHESVAREFEAFLSGLETEYSPYAYVSGELQKDVSYLATSAPKRPLVVAENDNRVVGCVYLYDLPADEGEIKRLYVRDDYRGHGLGRRLMEALIEYAERSGYSALRLDTAPFMDSARRLYRELGFEPYDGGESVSDIPEPILDDIIYMRVKLRDE